MYIIYCIPTVNTFQIQTLVFNEKLLHFGEKLKMARGQCMPKIQISGRFSCIALAAMVLHVHANKGRVNSRGECNEPYLIQIRLWP